MYFLLLSASALFLCVFSPVSAQTLTQRNPADVAKERIRDMALSAFVLGAASEAEEDYPAALASYGRALEMDADAVIHLAIARVAEALHDEITAVHHLLRARETRPDDPALLRKLGEVYSSRRQADSATVVLEELRRIEGESENLLQALGSLYANQRAFDRAADVYDSLRTRFPGNPMYVLMLAEMEMNRGRWDAASDLLLPLSADSAVGHEDRIQIGKLYFQKALQERRDIERAITVFTNLQRDFPDDWRPFWFRGAVLFNSGSPGAAMTDFEHVMRLSPGNTEAGTILARAYVTQARPADAVRILQQLVDRGAAGRETWALLGYSWSALGKNDRAVEAFEHARRSDPGNIEVLASLAAGYADLGRYDSSDAVYEELLRLHDEQGMAKDDRYYLLLNNFAYTLAERGVDLERALAMSAAAVASAPGNSAFCDTRGWLHFLLEQYDEALEWLGKALQLREADGGPSAVLHEHIGEVYRALDRPAEARAHWEEALRQEPSNGRLREKLELLK